MAFLGWTGRSSCLGRSNPACCSACSASSCGHCAFTRSVVVEGGLVTVHSAKECGFPIKDQPRSKLPGPNAVPETSSRHLAACLEEFRLIWTQAEIACAIPTSHRTSKVQKGVLRFCWFHDKQSHEGKRACPKKSTCRHMPIFEQVLPASSCTGCLCRETDSAACLVHGGV